MQEFATAFAETNIALVKYWGKRDLHLNLPMTSSLSYSLPLGTTTSVCLAEKDRVIFNGKELVPEDPFFERLMRFLDLFRKDPSIHFHIETTNQIPTAAGLASSASGFAALVLALDKLFNWNLSKKELSILARRGSGSASRSIYSGFVEWHRGEREDGEDSFAEPIETTYDELEIGLWILHSEKKAISSRVAMQRTVLTSTLYHSWKEQVEEDLKEIKQAILNHDFETIGKVAERNCLAMHATMIASWPPVLYWTEKTIASMHKIWKLRQERVLSLYFTMDAGPNLKVLYQKKERQLVGKLLPDLLLSTV